MFRPRKLALAAAALLIVAALITLSLFSEFFVDWL
jgi:hypothetical protein